MISIYISGLPILTFTGVAMLKNARRQTICTAATLEEKNAFETFCQTHGIKPSEMIRLLISKVCPKTQGVDAEEKIDERKNEQMIIRWHQRDWDALGVIAKEQAITRQEWVRKKVRAALHKTIPLSSREIRSLDDSCRELSAIGRNLNQIARRLNESNGTDNQMTLAYIQNFAKLIEVHTDKVGDAMRAANGRYGEISKD